MGLNFDYTTGSVAGQKAKAEGMAKVAKPNAAWIIRCHKAIPFPYRAQRVGCRSRL